MKNMKKTITASTLALSVALGGISLPAKNAEAGIIVGVASVGMLGPIIGVGLSAAGFFWGIQHDDLRFWTVALFVLEEKLEANTISSALLSRYPELDSSVASEIAAIVMSSSKNVGINAEGFGEIVLEREQLAPVLQILELTNPAMAESLINDLTVSSVR